MSARSRNESTSYAAYSAKQLENIVCFLYFALFLTAGLLLIFHQPFGNPPDEYNRFLIPEFIAETGHLPIGFEESIRIPGYGFSYAFQPILPYMIQGYLMRFVRMFTESRYALVLTGRFVDLIFGLVMAVFVLKLAELLFKDVKLRYLFAFLVMFLPQSIFVHTYINTDSCCMMSIAMMLYGIVKCIRDRFRTIPCVVLSIGIIFCALSYYNAYGFILSCILLFFAAHLNRESASGRLKLDARSLIGKGFLVSVIVLIGITWWFARSYVLFDGDFLGLRTRNDMASLYALPAYHPDTRVTWQNQGYSVIDMLKSSDFLNLSLLSFIGIYGPMEMPASIWLYRFYKVLFAGGVLACVLIPAKLKNYSMPVLFPERKTLRRFFHLNMLFCMVMPFVLSVYYSYATDYQPQGRYLLPMLIPLAYVIVRGIEKALVILAGPIPSEDEIDPQFSYDPAKNTRELLVSLIPIALTVLIAVFLLFTVFGYALPYFDSVRGDYFM